MIRAICAEGGQLFGSSSSQRRQRQTEPTPGGQTRNRRKSKSDAATLFCIPCSLHSTHRACTSRVLHTQSGCHPQHLHSLHSTRRTCPAGCSTLQSSWHPTASSFNSSAFERLPQPIASRAHGELPTGPCSTAHRRPSLQQRGHGGRDFNDCILAISSHYNR